MARRFRTYNEVPHDTASGVLEQVLEQQSRLTQRLGAIARVAAVVSGKGGVGKSAVTANLATLLSLRGARVGALDADLNGPSLGRMLGVAAASLHEDAGGVQPAQSAHGVRVMSMDLLLPDDEAPLRWKGPDGHGSIWRGAAEAGTLREFVSDVAWGPLDWLLIDVPPGTDRIERTLELLPRLDLVLLVTTPSEIARFVVGKSARLLRDAEVARVGLVANMTRWIEGDEARPLYSAGGAERLAEDAGLPLWAEIPFEPALAALTDAGRPIVAERPDSPSARALHALAERLLETETAA